MHDQKVIDRLKAIALMVTAVTSFAALDTAAKYLITHSHLAMSQVVWSRFIGQFVLLAIFVPLSGVLSLKALFTTRNLKLQVLRSTLMVGTTAFNFMALKYLRLDQTITIVFLAPLVVALSRGSPARRVGRLAPLCRDPRGLHRYPRAVHRIRATFTRPC